MDSNHEQTENKMGVMPVRRLLLSMALPMMASMLVQAFYNIVDSIFVSRLSEDALTAVSLAFPMQNLIIGVAGGIGVGTNALLSRYLGEKKQDKANEIAMHGIFLIGCSYVIFLFIGIFFTRAFLVMQGAKGDIITYGEDYLYIILICSFACFFQIIFERLLQSTGRTLYSMYTQGTGAIINIILDPIFIFGLLGCPKMGIKGAALATVTGQMIAAVMAIIFNRKVNKEIHITFRNFKLSLRKIWQILVIGVPSVLMIAIGSVMTVCVNKILVVFTSTAVAVFGAYFKLQSFVFMPIFGLNSGLVPIVAYNYGAKKYDRVTQAVKNAVVFAVTIMLVGLVCVQIFPKQLLLLFDASDNMLGIGIPAMRIISISFIFAGYCIIVGSFFQALGNSIYSMIVSFVRQLVFLVPAAYFLSKTGNVNMVWFAWPIAEIASVLVSTAFLKVILKEKFSKEKIA
ncbi:MAG: MATE family efflux transporter [Lachnospiraceae bacterium]